MHNGILLNHKKEPLWVSANEKDEPGAYYTEVSQKEKQQYSIIGSSFIHLIRIDSNVFFLIAE